MQAARLYQDALAATPDDPVLLSEYGYLQECRGRWSIRAAIEACSVLEGNGVDISTVTSSVGVATYPDHAGNAADLFRAADAAMYTVKHRGKNAVAVATTPAKTGL